MENRWLPWCEYFTALKNWTFGGLVFGALVREHLVFWDVLYLIMPFVSLSGSASTRMYDTINTTGSASVDLDILHRSTDVAIQVHTCTYSYKSICVSCILTLVCILHLFFKLNYDTIWKVTFHAG